MTGGETLTASLEGVNQESLRAVRRRRTAVRVLLLALVLVLVGASLALLQTLRAERDAREQVGRASAILTLLRESLRHGVDAETGQRGFLITNDEIYLEPYANGAMAWLPAIDALEAALARIATPAQTEALGRLRELAVQKLDELETTVQLARAGNRAAAIDRVVSDTGFRLMDEYRDVLFLLEAEEERLLDQALQRASDVETRTVPLLLFLVFCAAGLVLLGLRLERGAAVAEAAQRELVAVREARDRANLLARELNHRVNNLFAVVGSIVSLSARGETDPQVLVRKVRERIQALAAAHLATQGPEDRPNAMLGEVIGATLRPHDIGPGRLHLDGPAVQLDMGMVTPLGLIAHELATNAAKYGSLSEADGRVEVAWTVKSDRDPAELHLSWREIGGPPVAGRRGEGFGSLMMRQAAMQLGGRVEHDWRIDGVEVTLVFPLPS